MKKMLCDEYITYEDVMSQQEIFCVASNSSGVFFLCFDYYAPVDAKLWYKFSVDPFDIDFLKFKRVDYGIFRKDKFTNNGLSTMLKYLHTCKAEYASKNANLLNETFFRGGKPSITIKKLIESKRLKNKEEKYGKLDLNRLYRIKSRLTSKVKTWLERLYQEYNFFDNSIEYIQEYYNNWTILVQTIQNQKESIIEPIWRFIKSHKIHSFGDFILEWKKVVNREIHVRNVGYSDVIDFYETILKIYYKDGVG